MILKYYKEFVIYFLAIFFLIISGMYGVYIGFLDLFSMAEIKGGAILADKENGLYYIDKLSEFNIIESLSGYIVIILLFFLFAVKDVNKYLLNRLFFISVLLNLFLFYFGITDCIKKKILLVLQECGLSFSASIIFLTCLFLGVAFIFIVILKRKVKYR